MGASATVPRITVCPISCCKTDCIGVTQQSQRHEEIGVWSTTTIKRCVLYRRTTSAMSLYSLFLFFDHNFTPSFPY